ncbi:membrane protein [Limnochorda pilosa]|uniref:Membrane protein n=2 Tax=Limnochorda pilosa TaxID=1555112 RepID=A0A0K2SLL1_LIMPI|nr:membrane protein [Limnochorda pilosa]
MAIAMAMAWVALLAMVLVQPTPAAAGRPLRAVMISPYGKGVPFDSLAYQGLEDAAEKHGLQVKLVEARDQSEYESQIQAMAELGYDIVFALHDYFAEPMKAVAPLYPGTTFILIDSQVDGGLPNMLSVAMEPQEGCYLAGIAAAHATQSKKVGFIGGLDHPIIIQFLAGFEAGLHSVDPEIDISVAFSGVFDDPVKGREMALAMIDRGADVIMHAADFTGVGVLKAAAERGVWGVGVDLDQSDVAPGHVLASALKDARGAVRAAVQMVVEGTFEPGVMIYGLEQGADLVAIPADLSFYREHPEVLAAIERAQEEIKAGIIVVPKTTKTR